MTPRPRPYHRAEAERLLDYADEWTAQAGELSPEASELSCLAYAAVHALLALHDALTAADRYAANEAKQREEAEPEMSEAAEWLSRGGSDPLDEDDHRDRVDGDGGRIIRKGPRHWHTPIFRAVNCDDDCVRPSLRDWDRRFGPLTFAPELAQDGAGDDLTASEDGSGSVEGGEGDDAQEAILCPECGHDIDRHAYDDDRAVDLCGECPDTERCPTPLPSQVARALIADAVKAERGGRRG